MKKVLILFILLPMINTLYGDGKDYSQQWLYNHGDYVKEDGKHDPRVKWAGNVFLRVEDVADKTGTRRPRLFIINTGGKPYAQALPDGGIVINPITLDICYEDADREEGDRRMAFILGHELAHLGSDDFKHMEAFIALQKHGEKRTLEELKKVFKRPESKTKELLADKKGAIYAAMAGYDISKLFVEKNNFLQRWADQIGVGYAYDGYSRYPSFQSRLEFIRPQLSAVAEQVELFKAGVLLFQMGSYRDSISAFREFSRHYPAREVFNNIGMCHLQLALRHLSLKSGRDYFRFRLAAVMDNSTSAETLHTTRSDYLKDKDFSSCINKAEDHFKWAVGLDTFDRNCRYNLAAALILKKEYAEAQAVCKKILKMDENDVYALNNMAIAFYYYGKEEDVETTQKAIQNLEKAHRLKPDGFEVLYNLASLKQERNRLAGAKLYWEKYLNLSTAPRDNYYFYIYNLLNGKMPPKPGETTEPPPIPAGINLGDSFAPIREKWGKGNVRSYKFGNEAAGDSESWDLNLQMMIKDNIRVTALDGTVEIVEWELSTGKPMPGVLRAFGPPQKVIRHSAGNFYIYEGMGFSIKEVNGKAHSYIRFQKTF